ncbi:MAG: type II toxin-antitoxin system HicB family antitoxin [Clostridia bacterium]|nr:type II toxin-antitoxin system HicB family antitoxin [Clostridia bacterium]
MEYKGYIGSVEFSPEDRLFFGKVQGVQALISYEGQSVDELIADFQGAVDDYLALCEQEHVLPEKAYKGSFNVRISPELHRRAAIWASSHQTTLNKVIIETVLIAMLHEITISCSQNLSFADPAHTGKLYVAVFCI